MGSEDFIPVVDNTNYLPTLQPKYVLLGMLDDYLGRSPSLSQSTVETFYPKERRVAEIFMSYLCAAGLNAGGEPNLQVHDTGHVDVLCAYAREQIDHHYVPDPKMFRPSLKLSRAIFPEISRGQYRPDEVDPRFSYLYGVYLRYGSQEPFSVRLANSVHRVELIKEFLVDLNAKWASHKFTIRTAPVCNDIAFEPDEVLGGLLLVAIQERRT